LGAETERMKRMAIHPVVGPANFNLAVESLRQTLRQEKDASTALSHAIQAPSQGGHRQDEGNAIPDRNLGIHVNTRA